MNRPTQNLTGWKRWMLVEKLTLFDKILRRIYKKIGRYNVNINCQQICKILRKKDLTEVKLLLKVFFVGGYPFWNTLYCFYIVTNKYVDNDQAFVGLLRGTDIFQTPKRTLHRLSRIATELVFTTRIVSALVSTIILPIRSDSGASFS